MRLPCDAVEESMRVLVLTPRGRDAELTCELLASERIDCKPCDTMTMLCEQIELGAGTAIVTEDALDAAARARFSEFLTTQPAWSDFQLIVFGDQQGARIAQSAATLALLGNICFIDRPVRVHEMVAAVHGALRARRKQYEARRAIHSRDQFLAMLGHELRNPLGAIHLAVQMETLKQRGPAPSKHLEVIARQAKHLARLVDDLLDVARVTYGKVVLKRTRLDLRDVLKACLQTVEHELRAQALQLSFQPPTAPTLVMGDSIRLEQVFGNLLTNAIKYTPKQGTITLSISSDNGIATVRIADTGIGIEPAMLPRVFELFAQADRSLDRSQGGMGLGLTLVYNLVQLHGGSVEAVSKGLGQGSEFIVRLPLLAAAAQARDGQACDDKKEGPLRVTLVEDNEDLRAMFEELLIVHGHQVSTAADGPEGVAQILKDRPDVAFVDVGLPGFDGFEVARRVRSQGVRARLVAVTGYGQPEDRARALDAGFDFQLTKPVNFADITAMLAAK